MTTRTQTDERTGTAQAQIWHHILRVAAFCLCPGLGAGPLPPEQVYSEAAGVIEAEAENYHALTSMGSNAWIEEAGAFANASGGLYLRALPDDGDFETWEGGARADYLFRIDRSGVYQLEVRWSGDAGTSDSAYFGVPDLADGPGGEPDWFQDSSHYTPDFDAYGWDALGEAEADTAAAAQNQMLLKLGARAAPYTLRIVMREDGVAVDAWRLTYQGPLPEVFATQADQATLRIGDLARIDVLANDTGSISFGSLTILTQPTHGTASVDPAGAVVYTHSSDTALNDAFTYQVSEVGTGTISPPTAVTIEVTTANRFESRYTDFPPTAPENEFRLVEALPGITFESPHAFAAVEGDANKLFVAEAEGLIWLIPDITLPNPEKILYLDLSDRVHNNGNEVAMKGLACHPDFASNGYLYASYNTATRNSILARYGAFPGNPPAGDPDSELILIDQLTEDNAHSIATCRFGPDGYLYVSFGDEGSQEDAYGNSQRIDKDLFSSILRIDVDKMPGNLEPNPDSDIPRDSQGKAHFSIPADNPFVGVSTFNGQSVLPTEVRTEIFMMGFRNPWQFAFLPESESLLVADVGRSNYEELSIIPPGGNGGWAWREGLAPGVRSGELINGAAESDATLTDPFMSYSHGVGSSITGGIFYDRPNYPGLRDRYIFADYVAGSVWATDPFAETPTRQFLTAEQAIVDFLISPSDGGILLLDRGLVGGSAGLGRVLKLEYGGEAGGDFPTTLTETNFFADITSLSPNPGGIAYEPNLRFWSDYAEKSRWFMIPEPDDQVSFERDTPWAFPLGMIWVKHFDLEMERGNPLSTRRIETRFLVKTEASAYGVSYRWNEAQTEAHLAASEGEDIELTILSGGEEVIQQWRIPSRADCLICHTETAGHALSFNTRQLNRDGQIHGLAGNFLQVLHETGYLEGLDEPVSELPRHLRPDETAYSLEARARAYLAVNCAYCHQPSGGTPLSWDGRAHLKLFETSIVEGAPADAPLDPLDRLLKPGSTTHSIIWNRMTESNGYSRMPPLASNEIDPEGAALLAAWILDELPDRIDYHSWRLLHFVDPLDPTGASDQDPDLDGRDNHAEFIAGSDPQSFDSSPTPELRVSEGQLSILRPALLGRNVILESSTDLGATDPWAIFRAPGSDVMPPAEDVEIIVEPEVGIDRRFFRFRYEEE